MCRSYITLRTQDTIDNSSFLLRRLNDCPPPPVPCTAARRLQTRFTCAPSLEQGLVRTNTNNSGSVVVY